MRRIFAKPSRRKRKPQKPRPAIFAKPSRRKRKPQKPRPAPALSWQDLHEEFLGFYLPPPHPRSTQFSVSRMLDVCAELGVKSVSDLTPKLVTKFCARTTGKHGKPITLRTVQGQLVYLKLLCQYAVSQKYLKTDPTLARKVWISDQALSEPGLTHLSAAEARDVIRQADAEAASGNRKARRLRMLVYFLAFLGLRKKEVLGLECRDVDMTDRTVLIRRNSKRAVKTGKKGEAYLPLPDPLYEQLCLWLPHCGGKYVIPACDVDKPWMSGGPSSRPLEQLRALGQRAGVYGVNFKIWRSTWATIAEGLWGLTDEQIQRILRHTSPLTSKQFYRHRDLANMRAHMAKVSYEPQKPTLSFVDASR
jgi:integrase